MTPLHSPSYLTDSATLRWLVIHTLPHQEQKVYDLLRGVIGATEADAAIGNLLDAWLPTHTVRVVSGGRTRETPLLNGFVFVHATELAATTFLLNHYREGFLLRDRTGNGVMTIPDDEMRRFMDFNTRVMADMLVLEHPYYKYDRNPRLVRARVNNGPFAGLEGVLIHLRNERRLVFRLGELAVAVSQIWRYELTRINTDVASSPEERAMQPHLAADRLVGLLQAAGCVDNAPQQLRHLVDLLQNHPTLTRLRACLTADDPRLHNFLKHLDATDAGRLLSLAKLVRETPDGADTYIPLLPLRPFLTPTAEVTGLLPRRHFTEIIRPVDLEELYYDAATETTSPRRHTYYAHLALVPAPTAGTPSMLITDWSALITPYRHLEGAAKHRQDTTFAAYCPDLLALFNGTHPSGITIQTVTLPNGTTITGPALRVPEPDLRINELSEDILTSYLHPLLSICKAIAASTHLSSWRGYLRRVWMK